MIAVGALALAGGLLSGRVTESEPRPIGGAAFGAAVPRRRLRLALTEQHAEKLRPILARFEAEHETSVAVTALPESELFTMLAVELLHETQTLDLVSLSDDWVPSLGRPAVLMTETDLASTESVAVVYDRVIDLGRSLEDEQLVAAPWTLDIGFTAVDGGAVGITTPPRRWSELAELMERSGLTSMALAGASGEVAAATYRAILSGYGKDIVEVGTNRPTVTDYDARRAMATMRRLQEFTTVLPLAVDDRALRDLVARGTVTSCAHVWASTWLDAGAPPHWMLLPPLRASVPRGARLLRSWLFAIPRTAQDVQLSRTFVEWMLSPVQQRTLLDVGLVPTSRAVLGDRDEQTNRPALADVIRGLPSSVARPRIRSFPEINRVCGEAVARVLAGNATAGGAFRAANAEMRRILEREGELRL